MRPHVPDPDSRLAGLTDADFITEINRRYGGIPREVLEDKEMMALVLPALRADIAALESCQPNAMRIACPLTVFGGTEDSRVPAPHLEAWREVAAGPFRKRLFPGDHFYIGPRRADLLADIAMTLAPMLAESAPARSREAVE